MILNESHILHKTNKNYDELDHLCFLSKNLYNYSLYYIRQYYIKENKYISPYELINILTKEKHIDYIALPRKISQQIILDVHNNFKSFFHSVNIFLNYFFFFYTNPPTKKKIFF